LPWCVTSHSRARLTDLTYWSSCGRPLGLCVMPAARKGSRPKAQPAVSFFMPRMPARGSWRKVPPLRFSRKCRWNWSSAQWPFGGAGDADVRIRVDRPRHADVVDAVDVEVGRHLGVDALVDVGQDRLLGLRRLDTRVDRVVLLLGGVGVLVVVALHLGVDDQV